MYEFSNFIVNVVTDTEEFQVEFEGDKLCESISAEYIMLGHQKFEMIITYKNFGEKVALLEDNLQELTGTFSFSFKNYFGFDRNSIDIFKRTHPGIARNYVSYRMTYCIERNNSDECLSSGNSEYPDTYFDYDCIDKALRICKDRMDYYIKMQYWSNDIVV